MPRISDETRERLHEIVDKAIDKMNAPKNENKENWRCLENKELSMLLEAEVKELCHAVEYPHHASILSECFDVINFALMIADNAQNGKV